MASSSVGRHDITIKQGATWTRRLTWRKDGQPIVLPNEVAVAMKVRDKPGGVVLASIDSSLGNGVTIRPNEGQIELCLTATQTRALPYINSRTQYCYDVRVDFGDESVAYLIEGQVSIDPVIT